MKPWLLCLLALGACKKDAPPPALGEAISVAQPGGSASELFTRGSEIPTSATESFTTGQDGEQRIFIHVLRGEGNTASALHSDGWYGVDGVAKGKAGEPRVMVTFEIDAQGRLSVTARQDARRLAVRRMEKLDHAQPSPLTEPDDDDDPEDDAE